MCYIIQDRKQGDTTSNTYDTCTMKLLLQERRNDSKDVQLSGWTACYTYPIWRGTRHTKTNNTGKEERCVTYLKHNYIIMTQIEPNQAII